jgi:hypothetical protein
MFRTLLEASPPCPSPAAAVQQRPVERREVSWREPLQQHATKRRDDVPLHSHAIAGPGRRPHPRRSYRRQPLVYEEGAEAARRRPDERAFAQPGKRLVERLLTLPLGPEAALAALPALAGHGIGHADVPGVGAPPPADAAPHQRSSSTGRPSISSSR